MNLTLTNKIDVAYSSPPWWYDLRGFLILKSSYRSGLLAQVAFFEKNLRADHLEVAIGSGTLFAMVLRWRRWRKRPMPNVVGIDYAEAMLAGARRRFRDDPNIELLYGDVCDLPHTDDSFDSVNIANAFHCFADADGALESIHRVLRPGGTLAANVLLYPRGWQPCRWLSGHVNRWGIRKGILHTPYEADDVREKLKAHGFEIVEERIAGNTFNVVARKV